MRVLLLVLAALIAGALLYWAVPGDEVDLDPGTGGSGAAAASSDAPQDPAHPPADAPRVEVRSLLPQRAPEGLAGEPTAWLRVVDAETDQPIEGAAIYRVRDVDEAALAYTDARGLAGVPLSKPTQLMVAARGHLLRLAPTRPGTTPDAPQGIRLHVDRYGVRGTFAFVGPDGAAPTDVCVRLRPIRSDRADLPMSDTLRAAGEEAQRAWREQSALAAARTLPELHVQLGFRNESAVHVLRAGDEVSFVEPGRFELEAATPEGLAARLEFDTSQFAAGPMQVRLQRGAFLTGRVVDAAGRAVAGAYLAIDGGDPLRLAARSGADGGFAIGPLARGTRVLEVRHRDHEVGRHGPIDAGATPIEVRLTPLPPTSVRGRIVAAGTGRPIPGASASLLVPNAEPLLVEADAEGFFAARTSGSAAVRVNAGAEGFLTHSELVTPGDPALAIELWPGAQEQRLALRLSAVLAGVVVDGAGGPVAGAALRWEPEVASAQTPGRRVLAGGALSLPQAVTSGPDGRFAMEVAAFGPGSLRVIGSTPEDEVRQPATATAGRADTDLRVVTRRRGR